VKIFKSLGSVIIGLLFAGCATTTPVDSQARALCVQTFGTDAYLKVLWLPISHVEGFTMVFAGNTGPQLEIANAMEAAKNKRVDLVVWTGPHGEAAFAIEQSLRYIRRDERLESLNFLFVGDAQDAERIRPKIEMTGAKFYFHKR